MSGESPEPRTYFQVSLYPLVYCIGLVPTDGILQELMLSEDDGKKLTFVRQCGDDKLQVVRFDIDDLRSLVLGWYPGFDRWLAFDALRIPYDTIIDQTNTCYASALNDVVRRMLLEVYGCSGSISPEEVDTAHPYFLRGMGGFSSDFSSRERA